LLATLKPLPSQRKSRQAVELENRYVNDEEWLDELIIPIQQHPDFESASNLEQALEKWWQDRFTQQYNEIVTTVDQALKNWAVEKARQSVSTLLKPTLPTHLRDKVTQLQQNIGQVENDKQRLETQLSELKTHLTDWTVVQKLMTLSQALQAFEVKSKYVVPQNWQAKINTTLEELSTRTQNFIATQARASRDLSDVRNFYIEFKKLAYNDLKLDWFKHVQKTYQEATEYMAAQNWQKVQNAITQFERAGGEKNALERLKVLLTVKQAESLDRLADILKEQWFLIKLYLSDQVGKLLDLSLFNCRVD